MEPDNTAELGSVRASAGIGDLRFHDLRPTCVTLLPNLGVPHQTVA